jgi:hypothetical protein
MLEVTYYSADQNDDPGGLQATGMSKHEFDPRTGKMWRRPVVAYNNIYPVHPIVPLPS